MVSVQREDYIAIEKMIERYRLQGLLEIIAFICGEMAKKVRAQWRDEPLAQTWEQDALSIDKARGFIAN